jgi:selenocysteine-specific translation elongation factor
MKRGNFLLQNKLKKSKTKKQLKKICREHKEDFHREMKKYSLNQLTKRIFESLKKDQIEEVLDDPIFFFRDHEEMLKFIQKRIRTIETKYLKKKSVPKLRRVKTEWSKRSVKGIYCSKNQSSRRLFHISPQVE